MTLKTFTNQETVFVCKSLDLLGVGYSLETDVRKGLIHDEITFSCDSEQTRLLNQLMEYNYKRG